MTLLEELECALQQEMGPPYNKLRNLCQKSVDEIKQLQKRNDELLRQVQVINPLAR